MRCALVVVQGHALPSQIFFEPVVAQVQFGHSLLQIAILALEAGDLIGIGLAYSIARQALLPGFQEVLAPAVIQVGIDAFLAAQFSNLRALVSGCKWR
jgi:hypothetical protein